MAFGADTISTATLGGFTSGVFSDTFDIGGADVDIIALQLQGGRRYRIDVDGGGDTLVRIFDAAGNELKANDDGADFGETLGLQPYTQLIPSFTGTHYVALSPYYLRAYDPTTTVGRTAPANALPFSVGTLIVTELWVDAFPDPGSIAGITAKGLGDRSDAIADLDRKIRVEFEASTVVDVLDVEMGRFDLEKGDVVAIDVNGEVDANVLDALLRVFDASGVEIARDDSSGFGLDSELVFAAGATGPYYIAVSGSGNGSYDAVTGAGTTPGDTGAFRVVLHRNPDQIGTTGADIVTGTPLADYLVGMAGDDSLSGLAAADVLSGGDGNDVLVGGDGADRLFGDFGNDDLAGGNGPDMISGGLGDDVIAGGSGDDVLEGDEGDDVIDGGNQNDTIRGGAGDDTLVGASGDDWVDGGDGNDTIHGGTGRDTLLGGAGDDALYGRDDDDVLDGGTGNDLLAGDNGNDVLRGGDGADTLQGLAGDDVLEGGAGDDTLQGGQGRDVLRGGAGADTLTGGLDGDVFDFDSVLDGMDRVTDFLVGTDRIDLATIVAAAGSIVTAANWTLFVRVTAGSGGGSLVAVDPDGAGAAFGFTTIAQVDNVAPATLADFGSFVF
jgi:Ca2+-binding RTX toxin-like protein